MWFERMVRRRRYSCSGEPDVTCHVLEQHALADFIRFLESNQKRIGALQKLLGMYRITRNFPDLSNFRLGPNMFKKIPLDWILLTHASGSQKRSELIGHGIATRITWNGDPRQLPSGWQGTVRRCYENTVGEQHTCDTLVGLFIKVEEDFRERGWAGRVVTAMKELGKRSGLSNLIIPLRLPTHYEKRYAAMPFEEFALLKRENGEYLDHWLRLHVRLGAEIIGLCKTSHQHALNVDDLRQQFECAPIEESGDHLVSRHGEWFRAYVDLERECALVNQGCVWVRHSLS